VDENIDIYLKLIWRGPVEVDRVEIRHRAMK
jgi:hypothetical protein